MGNTVSGPVLDTMEKHVLGWLDVNGGSWEKAYEQHNIDAKLGGQWAMILQVEVDTFVPCTDQDDAREYNTRNSFVHLNEVRLRQGKGDILAFPSEDQFPELVLTSDLLVSLEDELEMCMDDSAVVLVQLFKEGLSDAPSINGPTAVFQCSDSK